MSDDKNTALIKKYRSFVKEKPARFEHVNRGLTGVLV